VLPVTQHVSANPPSTGTESLLEQLLHQDPGSLAARDPQGTRESLLALYGAYRSDLASVCRDMAEQRPQIVGQGFSASFGDREAELLYLVVRAVRPSLVVEISPCFGYSTNYLLAGLRDNGHGELHSYEIMTEARGRPIEEVIRANLHPALPQRRLVVHVGDARMQDVPAADLLFIDSAHAAPFAAWAFETQVNRARWVFHHDIVLREAEYYAPKAWTMGPRESSTTLELLRMSGQKIFAAATSVEYLREQTPDLATRFSELAVAILYRGHAITPQAARLTRTILRVHDLRRDAVEGTGEAVLTAFGTDLGFVERCAYGALLAEMGVPKGRFSRVPDYHTRVRPHPAATLSSGELVFYLEYLMKASHVWPLLRFGLGLGPNCTNERFASAARRDALRGLLVPEVLEGEPIKRLPVVAVRMAIGRLRATARLAG
jgi:hypothetical protein